MRGISSSASNPGYAGIAVDMVPVGGGNIGWIWVVPGLWQSRVGGYEGDFSWEESLVHDFMEGVHALLERRAAGSDALVARREALGALLHGLMEAGMRLAASEEGHRPVVALTQRQRVVLECVRDGLRTNEIAVRLHMSASTVQSHVRDICARLEVSGRYEAVQKAVQTRLIERA